MQRAHAMASAAGGRYGAAFQAGLHAGGGVSSSDKLKQEILNLAGKQLVRARPLGSPPPLSIGIHGCHLSALRLPPCCFCGARTVSLLRTLTGAQGPPVGDSQSCVYGCCGRTQACMFIRGELLTSCE